LQNAPIAESEKLFHWKNFWLYSPTPYSFEKVPTLTCGVLLWPLVCNDDIVNEYYGKSCRGFFSDCLFAMLS
jgi:hypothetical protein